MSALPNSKSSLLYATRSCSALALAGAMILPLSPALAQNATADTPAAAGSQSNDRVRENPVATSDEFNPHLSYHSLKNTDEDQVLDFWGWGFEGDFNSPKGVQVVVREVGLNAPVLVVSDIIEYNHKELAFAYQDGYIHGTVKIPANTLDKSKDYVIEVWGNNGYEGDEFITPVVGQAPESRGTLLATQELDFDGSDGTTAADIPGKTPQKATFKFSYDNKEQLLYTSEGGTIHVRGWGYTKEWREKHGKVVVYIVASQGVPDGADVLPANDVLLRFEEGKDFTIAENGVLDAQLTVKPDALQSYYKPRAPFLGIPRYEKRYEVSYEIGMFTEMQGEPQLTVEDLQAGKNVLYRTVLDTQAFRSSAFAPKVEYKALGDTATDQSIYFLGTGFYGKFASAGGVQYVIREKGSNTPVLATSDIFWYNRYHHFSEFENGEVRGVVKVPASTLDPAKKYVVEVWSNDGYKNGEFAGPVVGKAPEGRSTLLASQDLNFKGSDATEGKQPSLTDEQRKERATRGELTAALYAQAGSPKVDLPETSPWPDVKTTDPNYAAYIWARQKGITFGWADGKFHADAGISNATVAAFTYRAAGSPTVQYWSPYTDVAPGSAFFREIAWAGQNKVALSTSGTFSPKHMVTRGELEVLMIAF
ncbi:MAG: gluconolactonase [Rothia sp.]|uniref:S-layer homology domain-containing protein n=1 Tax=Rothia sp. (in: high G+C Gram-positive bacteria) TaxID=1885016 RepID=UPI001CB5EECA|nr:S-layer homology domain-containing protein [Rothia sp. (in: high G+C Gram-positive bacteria)]MBF1676159.1 gluconolactonase [Rothia sp. (in: high G+C Gram-positive bacteria)]